MRTDRPVGINLSWRLVGQNLTNQIHDEGQTTTYEIVYTRPRNSSTALQNRRSASLYM